MCLVVCYSGNPWQTNEAASSSSGPSQALHSPEQVPVVHFQQGKQQNRSFGLWQSLQHSLEQEGRGATERRFWVSKGFLAEKDTFRKVKVESGEWGRYPGDRGLGKGGPPHSKVSGREVTAGAAKAGFLDTAQVALTGSADLQQGIGALYRSGILPEGREQDKWLPWDVIPVSSLGRPQRLRKGVPRFFIVASGKLSLRCSFLNCAGGSVVVGTLRGAAVLSGGMTYPGIWWQRQCFVYIFKA